MLRLLFDLPSLKTNDLITHELWYPRTGHGQSSLRLMNYDYQRHSLQFKFWLALSRMHRIVPCGSASGAYR